MPASCKRPDVVCEAILAKDPEDSFALSLKNYARATLVEAKASTDEAVPSDQTAQYSKSPQGAVAGTIRQCAGRSTDVLGRPLPVLSTNRAILEPKRQMQASRTSADS